MDDANKKLENGLEPIYDHVRRPFKRLYLNRAVTQNYLQGLCKSFKAEYMINTRIYWKLNLTMKHREHKLYNWIPTLDTTTEESSVLRDFLQVDRSTPTAKSLLTIKIL